MVRLNAARARCAAGAVRQRGNPRSNRHAAQAHATSPTTVSSRELPIIGFGVVRNAHAPCTLLEKYPRLNRVAELSFSSHIRGELESTLFCKAHGTSRSGTSSNCHG